MAKKIIIYTHLILILIVLFCTSLLHARVSVSTTLPDITNNGKARIADLTTKMLNINGDALANSSAIVNITGYPVGSAILEGFPRFLVGFAFSTSFANMHFFDKQSDKEVGLIPVGSMNPVIYFGFGLKKGFDILVKIMAYNDYFFYKPPLNFGSISLDGMSLYSGGVKMRYNIIKKISVFPGIFNFGGLTFGLSGDVIYGTMQVSGKQDISFTSVEVLNPVPTLMDVTYDSSYSVDVNYITVTAAPEIKVHLNFFLIFDVYTGFSFPASWGMLNIGIDSTGPSSSSLHSPTPDLGDIVISGTNTYKPFYIMPVYIGGIEMNIYVLRFTFETCVNLYNRSDVNVQLGVRTQW